MAAGVVRHIAQTARARHRLKARDATRQASANDLRRSAQLAVLAATSVIATVRGLVFVLFFLTWHT
jgi:hypothetical protein